MIQHRSVRMTGLAFTAVLTFGCEAREVEAPRDVPPMAQTDAAAERQFIRLTGCVRPDAEPGRYVLASVATAGVAGGDEAEQARSWTTENETTFADQEEAIAASTYQLIPGEGRDLSKFENQRVTVRGLLAADVPGRTEGAAATTGEGQEVARSTTASKVEAQAPPTLRGLHVEDISKVADTCD